MAEQDEFIRVGTTLYKIVDQPLIDGGCVKKRIAWNSETLRQDYGKDRMATVPKYDGFCTVPDHTGYIHADTRFFCYDCFHVRIKFKPFPATGKRETAV